jgi:hypothetical protein
MERSNPEIPRFITFEELEKIEEYQAWIKTAFIEGLAGMSYLVGLRERFTLKEYDLICINDKSLNLELFQAARAEVCAKIEEEVEGATQDLQQTVFDGGLFHVGIVVGEETRLVKGVVTEGERVVPVVDGEPYLGPIDDVVFDR